MCKVQPRESAAGITETCHSQWTGGAGHPHSAWKVTHVHHCIEPEQLVWNAYPPSRKMHAYSKTLLLQRLR